ncbi:hypothetical protein KP509_12G053100 [Ceratopteris richardii]|uniref:Uncharacterized protein n=1 Tax=Ceratopteris richardii TaxID=49495 RepID=A0A8T2TJ39_CERRI|nr:hypothetical protein KP509_12G053100 [Ceratopteris richardii]
MMTCFIVAMQDASGARTMASQTNKKTKGLLFHAERLLQRHSSVAVETSPSKARKHLQATLHQSVPASYEGVLPFTDIPFLKENKVSIPLSERLLQDYAPTANERTPSHYRKLLQDYSPMANRRSPSINRKLLQELPTKRKDITPSSQDRLLQDYSPTANSRSPSINR